MNKGLKKFGCRILLILGAGILLYLHYARKDPLDYADKDSVYAIWERKFAETTHETHYRILFLGDSLANTGYLPVYLPTASINLALLGGLPAHEYYLLKRYLENNEAPDVCYVSFHDDHLKNASSFLSAAYARLLTFAEAREITMTGKKYGQRFSTNPPAPVWEYYTLSPRIYQIALVRGMFSNRRELNAGMLLHADRLGGAYLQPATVPFGEGSPVLDGFSVSPVNDDYYRRIIELCIASGIQVRLVKLPSHPSVSHTEGYKRGFADYYGLLKKDYPEITVDWFEHGLSEDCFVDTLGHMNIKGGYTLTRLLAAHYPEDFSRTAPLPSVQLEGLAEIMRQTGFDPGGLEPAGRLTDIFDD